MKNQFRNKLYSDLSPSAFETANKTEWRCECGHIKQFSGSTQSAICSCGRLMKKGKEIIIDREQDRRDGTQEAGSDTKENKEQPEV